MSGADAGGTEAGGAGSGGTDSGGTDAGGTDAGGTDAGGWGGGGTGPTHELCSEDGKRSFVEGLNPAVELDSLAHYSGVTNHLCELPNYSLEGVTGNVCASAADEASCLAEVERLVLGSADWGKYEDFFTASWGLLVATGSEENIQKLGGPVQELSGNFCGTWNRGDTESFSNGTPYRYDPEIDRSPEFSGGSGGESGEGGAGGSGAAPSPVPVSQNATTIADRATLLTLLGSIDTASEAALVMWANNFDPPCEIEEVGDSYRGKSRAMINDCPITYQGFELRVSKDGSFTSRELGDAEETDTCVGRRPHGLASLSASRGDSGFEAAWLANVARLETAAVVAFAQLSRELERLGAPAELAERARSAALEEIRHARDVNGLAIACGGEVHPVVVALENERSLLSLAVENAVEGCVRECWGALIAHYQARAAEAPRVREIWSAIAEEESGHAVLSLDIARWLDTLLSPAERALVESARRRAIEELRAELGHDSPGNATLGLPDRERRLALFEALILTLAELTGEARELS